MTDYCLISYEYRYTGGQWQRRSELTHLTPAAWLTEQYRHIESKKPPYKYEFFIVNVAPATELDYTLYAREIDERSAGLV